MSFRREIGSFLYESKSETVSSSVLSLLRPHGLYPPGFSVRGILQARIPGVVAIPFSRGSPGPSVRTWVSCIAGRFFTVEATREAREVFYITIYF